MYAAHLAFCYEFTYEHAFDVLRADAAPCHKPSARHAALWLPARESREGHCLGLECPGSSCIDTADGWKVAWS
jgi:hypothetical protein